MKLKGFDLDQVRAEAAAIEDHRQHELKRGRKPPEDDTIRIPVALLLALLNRVNPQPSKHDFRLTTSGYVRPGTYCGHIAQPNKNNDAFPASPSSVSAGELTDPPPGGYHPFLLEHLPGGGPLHSVFPPLVLDGDAVITAGAEVTVVPSSYAFTTTVDALHGGCDLHFPLTNVSADPLIVHPQEGTITHQGRVVGKVPVDSTGTVNIHSLTARCRMEHSMGCVVVEDVEVK